VDSDIRDRLNILIEDYFKQTKIAAGVIGVTSNYLSQIKKDKPLNTEHLKKLSQQGININWLLTGTGEMLLSDQHKVYEDEIKELKEEVKELKIKLYDMQEKLEREENKITQNVNGKNKYNIQSVGGEVKIKKK
jgi:transcriptional regulator with XRE-family HTH domain